MKSYDRISLQNVTVYFNTASTDGDSMTLTTKRPDLSKFFHFELGTAIMDRKGFN